MTMFILYLITTCILLDDAIEQRQPECPKQNLEQCPGYHLISTTKFKAFYHIQDLNEICNFTLSALKCVQDIQEICPASNKLPYDIQRNVINAICGNMTKEYMESVSCFTKSDIDRRTTNECFVFLTRTYSCNDLIRAVDCVGNVVAMTDGCNTNDVQLMKYLVQLYLKPVGELIRCTVLHSRSSNTVYTKSMKVTHFSQNPARETLSQSRSTWNTLARNETEINMTVEASIVTYSTTTADDGDQDRNNIKSNQPISAHSRASLNCSATTTKWISSNVYMFIILLFLLNH